MDYSYFNTVSWNKDLLNNLQQLMSTTPCYGYAERDDSISDSDSTCSYSPTFRDDSSDSVDSATLDSLRVTALEDFRHNGHDSELDTIDSFQVELRQHSAMETVIRNENSRNVNPIVLQVLEFKERKKLQRRAKAKKICVFCKNNGETSSVYSSHVLKDCDGRVCCPILRKYTCPLCGLSGDAAHTIKYCPRNQGDAPTLAVLQSNRVSNGKKRHH